MINRNAFLVEELPFSSLEKIGITREDVLHLPRPVIEPLISGAVTPLLMATIHKEDGSRVDVPLKLQLLRDKEGGVRALAYPLRKEILNDLCLSPLELEKLSQGEVLRKDFRDQEGRRQSYFQLDRETNSIIRKDAADLRLSDRIKEVEKLGDIELGLNQKKALLDGKPLELQLGDTKVTVGVDLRQPTGFKNLQGDMQAWEKAKQADYDRITSGFMGYVKTDANRWEYQQIVNSLQAPKADLAASKSMKMSV